MYGTILVLTLAACANNGPPPTAAGAQVSAAPASGAPTAAPAAAPATAKQVEVSGLQAARTAGPVVVLDVRTPEEFANGHVPGAVNVPVDGITAGTADVAAWKDTPLYVICQSGKRSAAAAGALSARGYDVTDVRGGTAAWIAAGYPTER